MVRTNKIKLWLMALTLLLFSGCSVLLSSCNNSEFTGNRIKNPDSYILDIETMNGKDEHKLSLEKGDELKVDFKTEKGSIKMEIKSEDGTLVYSGNGKEATSFTISIKESGVYSITVEAKSGKGNIHITKK